MNASAEVEVDFAVVLGCRPSSPLLASRCAMGVALVQQGRARRLFLTGTADEAAAMTAFVCAAGIDAGGIVVDALARRTADNIRNARAVVGDAPCLLVTSAFHLPRAMFLAAGAGLRATGVAVDDPALTTSTRLRELVSWPCAFIDRWGV